MVPTRHNKNYYRNNSSTLTWENVVKEVIARKVNGQKASILSSDSECFFARKIKQKKSLKINKPTYVLKTKCGDIPITKREAECISLLLKGETDINIANILKIAPRTVMDYINNIKARSNCNNRRQLIDIVRTDKNLP